MERIGLSINEVAVCGEVVMKRGVKRGVKLGVKLGVDRGEYLQGYNLPKSDAPATFIAPPHKKFALRASWRPHQASPLMRRRQANGAGHLALAAQYRSRAYSPPRRGAGCTHQPRA